jgi:hypothetical protein
LPTTVDPGGTSSTTTVFAPILAPSPTAIGPSSLEAGPAERHPLVEGDPLADLGCLADHNAGAVVDEELAADLRRRVDLDAGDRPGQVREHARRNRHPRLEQRVGKPVREQGLNPGPAQQDLQRRDSLRRRIAIAGGRDVGAHLGNQCLPSTHGEKKGRET